MLQLRPCVKRQAGLVNLTRCVALGIAAISGGCASNEAYRAQVYGGGDYPHQQHASAQNARAPAVRQRPPEPEIEDDGLPSQVAPPARRAREADDPTQPYSPNYGGGGSLPSQRAETPAPVVQRRVSSFSHTASYR